MVSIYDLTAGTSARRLTIGGRSTHPIWSHDGRSVIFTSESKGALNLFRQLADGTGSAEELMTKTETVGARVPQSLDPMGKVLAFVEYRDGIPAIWTKLLEGDDKATRFSEPGNHNQMQAEFSPDGRHVAYLSTELGTPQIFVKAYPSGAGSKYQVTTEGAGFPVWSSDGKLFYMVDPTNPKMNVVDVITQPAFSFGKPTTLPITGTIHPIPGFRNYDISPDGKQFVFVMPASENQSARKPVRPQINVVLNWFEDLKQRAR
jgi:Tol biopolymer transport system component